MGVNLIAQFGSNASVDNVASVVGKLLGLPSKMHNNPLHCSVEGIQMENGFCIGLVDVTFIAPKNKVLCDGEQRHNFNWHYEFGGGRARDYEVLARGCMPQSTPVWCAVMHHAIEFFGGKIAYEDCGFDGGNWDFVAKRNPRLNPSDGKTWNRFHRKVSAIKPLTVNDILAFNRYAAYKWHADDFANLQLQHINTPEIFTF